MALSHLSGHGNGHGHGMISLLDPVTLHGSVWDPFEGISVLDSAPARAGRQHASKGDVVHPAVANTQIDWRETPEAHIFKADLPGVKKEDVMVQVVDGRTLEIGGERKKLEEMHRGDQWHRLERAHGPFLRRFRLPENCLPDEVKAGVEDGVLTVTVPKAKKPKPQVRQIEVL